MTATPIPRTLSLTAYGDLDTTVLRELPAGRRPVKTWVVGEEKRAGAYEFVRERLREGRQAYLRLPAGRGLGEARGEGRRGRGGAPRGRRAPGLRGRAAPRADACRRRRRGRWSGSPPATADVLVATSVIEVGIDVPNATVMVIEGAERYGLSQLHQLRGRVGRGEHESFCILFGDPASETARRRLDAIAAERDGFKLAEVDLTLRGEGEILGTRQSGLPRFRVAELPGRRAAAGRGAARDARPARGASAALDDPALGPLLDAARVALRRRARRRGSPPRCASSLVSSRVARLSAPRRATRSGRRQTARVRPCSRCLATSPGSRSSTSSRAPARSRSRRSRAAPSGATLVDLETDAAAANVEALGLGDRAEIVAGGRARVPARRRPRTST